MVHPPARSAKGTTKLKHGTRQAVRGVTLYLLLAFSIALSLQASTQANLEDSGMIMKPLITRMTTGTGTAILAVQLAPAMLATEPQDSAILVTQLKTKFELLLSC